MIVTEIKSPKQISTFLDAIVFGQAGFEQNLNRIERKKSGVFLTNSLSTVDNVLDILEFDSEIFNKRILEPSCGQGIFILKLISVIYQLFPDRQLLSEIYFL